HPDGALRVLIERGNAVVAERTGIVGVVAKVLEEAARWIKSVETLAGAHPQLPIAIFHQGIHIIADQAIRIVRLIDVALKRLALRYKAIEDFGGGHPELPLAIDQEIPNEVIAQAVRVLGVVQEHVKAVAVVTRQTIAATDADNALLIPNHGIPLRHRHATFGHYKLKS